MKAKVICTDSAPAPIGPYSQAIEHNGFVFLSGQIPLDPLSGEIVGATVAEQTAQVLRNVKAILHSQGLNTESLVKATVFIRDMAAFTDFNKVYEKELDGAKPARSVVEVTGLPKNVLIEVEVIACR